jgi:membrane associated rhomboid family serine protease
MGRSNDILIILGILAVFIGFLMIRINPLYGFYVGASGALLYFFASMWRFYRKYVSRKNYLKSIMIFLLTVVIFVIFVLVQAFHDF